MAPRPTVIGTPGYRRGLASLSVVKELLFRVYRNALTVSGTCLVGLIRPCGLAFQLCPSLTGILLRVLVALRLASEFPCGNSPLVTRH